MERVIYNHAVQQAEVLYHGSATDVELSALVAGGTHARQHLHVLCDVGSAADGGHLLYLAGGQLLHAHLRLGAAFLHLVVGDFHRFKHLGGGF